MLPRQEHNLEIGDIVFFTFKGPNGVEFYILNVKDRNNLYIGTKIGWFSGFDCIKIWREKTSE